jgi:hypothetical protein
MLSEQYRILMEEYNFKSVESFVKDTQNFEILFNVDGEKGNFDNHIEYRLSERSFTNVTKEQFLKKIKKAIDILFFETPDVKYPKTKIGVEKFREKFKKDKNVLVHIYFERTFMKIPIRIKKINSIINIEIISVLKHGMKTNNPLENKDIPDSVIRLAEKINCYIDLSIIDL